MITTEEKFRAAVRVIQNLPKDGSFQPSADMKLKFYSHFKQATEGPCIKPKPAFWDVIEKKKWEEWKKLGNMSKEDAMLTYIDELKKVSTTPKALESTRVYLQSMRPDIRKEYVKNYIDEIVETMSYNDIVAEFLEVLGPFFEVAELEKPDLSAINGTNGGENKLTNGTGSDSNSDDYEKLECNGGTDPVSLKKAKKNAEKSPPIPVQNGHHSANKGNKRHDNGENFYSDHSDDSENDEFSDPVEEDAASSYSSTKSFVECKDLLLEESHSNVNGDSVGPEEENSPVVVPETTYTGFLSFFTGGRSSNPVEGADNDKKEADDRKTQRGGGDNSNSGGGARRRVAPGSRSNRGNDRGGSSSYRGGASDNQGGGGASVGRPGDDDDDDGGDWRPPSRQHPADITLQIADTLTRLQRDMSSVLVRLNTLEAITVAQHTSAQTAQLRLQEQMVQRQRPSWWPFPDLSVRTFLFFLCWPLFVQVLIKVWANRKLRKLPKK